MINSLFSTVNENPPLEKQGKFIDKFHAAPIDTEYNALNFSRPHQEGERMNVLQLFK